MDDRYSAAICMNGHYADRKFGFDPITDRPLDRNCRECGAPVIVACPRCSDRLLGASMQTGVCGFPDQFCACGMPYPWAKRTSVITYIKNQLQYRDDLSEEEQLELIADLAELTTPENPESRRVEAGERIKSHAPKAWAFLSPIFASILTAEIRVKLGLPPG